MNLENIPNDVFFWWILGFAGAFLVILFIVWVIKQLKNR